MVYVILQRLFIGSGYFMCVSKLGVNVASKFKPKICPVLLNENKFLFRRQGMEEID